MKIEIRYLPEAWTRTGSLDVDRMARVAARQLVSRDAFDFEWWRWDEVDDDDDDDFGRILDAC